MLDASATVQSLHVWRNSSVSTLRRAFALELSKL